MATSEVVTDYSTWIKNRWANGDTMSDAADALFDKVTDIVNNSTEKPTFDLPEPEDYYGISDIDIHTQLTSFLAMDADSFFDLYWEHAASSSASLTVGISAYEDDLYTKWENVEGAGATAIAIADAQDALVDTGLADLHNKIFPQAQLQFLPTNLVFTSGFQRFVLDQYENLATAATKFGADARLNQLDKGATRIIELIKVAAERATSRDALTAELMMKKTMLITQLEELQTKLTASINQSQLHDVISVSKYQYMYDVANLRWLLDNEKYRMEAFAALHGASTSSKSESVEGFAAMTDFEKGVNIAGASVSLLAGASSFAKDLGLI